MKNGQIASKMANLQTKIAQNVWKYIFLRQKYVLCTTACGFSQVHFFPICIFWNNAMSLHHFTRQDSTAVAITHLNDNKYVVSILKYHVQWKKHAIYDKRIRICSSSMKDQFLGGTLPQSS